MSVISNLMSKALILSHRPYPIFISIFIISTFAPAFFLLLPLQNAHAIL
jgi:hypothetical protein